MVIMTVYANSEFYNSACLRLPKPRKLQQDMGILFCALLETVNGLVQQGSYESRLCQELIGWPLQTEAKRDVHCNLQFGDI